MHAHGVEMYILSQGPGKWDGSTITNANNPLRRDVHMVQGVGHLVVQIDTWNVGIWAFHCHIAWHAAQGFFTQLIFNPHKIAGMDIPDSLSRRARNGMRSRREQWWTRSIVASSWSFASTSVSPVQLSMCLFACTDMRVSSNQY